MLKIQMALIALLIGCLTFTSCELGQELVGDLVTPPEVPEETVPEEMMAAYTSWLSATLPGPLGSGATAHPGSARIIYINDIGAMALQGGMTTFPAGTMVVKEIMSVPDASGETSVEKVERMEKSDDPMHADTSGWLYNGMGSQAGCHGCHVKAGVDPAPGMDGVFTADALMASLAAAGMDDGTMDDGTMDDGTMDDGTMDDGTMDDGTMDDGTMDDGTMDDGTMDDGTMDDGTMDDGTMDDGTMDDGTMDDGTMDDGTMDDGTMDDGTMDDGTMDDGTMSIDDGTMDDGTMDDDQ